MDAQDHREPQEMERGICHLEWIAWAIEAARKHKEIEHRQPLSSLRRRALERVDE
jgi:hypothetical protein